MENGRNPDGFLLFILLKRIRRWLVFSLFSPIFILVLIVRVTFSLLKYDNKQFDNFHIFIQFSLHIMMRRIQV